MNKDEKKSHKLAKNAGVKEVMNLLEELHLRVFGIPFDFKLGDLETFEKSIKFEHTLEALGVEDRGITEFLKV